MEENKAIGRRLFNLRKKANLTQTELYTKLQKIIAKKERTLVVESENGKRSICKMEKGAGLSLRNALAYSEFFNVSLDYLYLGTESYKPEYEDIKKILGFSDDALNKLEQLNKSNKRIIEMLNKLLKPELVSLFLELLNALFEHSYIKTKSLVSQYPGSTFINNCNIKGYYKRPIVLEPDDLEYISLFKISEISRNIANELKKSGGK